MRSIFFCIAIFLCLLANTAAGLAKDVGWGRVYTASTKVAVRESPSDSALQVRVLKPGQKVRVDFEESGWAAVFDPAETVRSEMRAHGYVRLAELRSGARAEPATRPEKTDASSKSDSSAKVEASAKGKKKDFKKPQPPQEFGEIRVADRKMSVRSGRDKDKDFVRLLKAGQRVRVDFQEDGWFAVFDPDEKVRDLSRAWGFGRDKYLIPEKDYTGEPLPEPAPAARETSAKMAPAAKETPAKNAQPGPKSAQKREAVDDEAVGYAVLERHTDQQRPLSPVVLRVRIDVPAPPAADALRKIMREIWKAERRKNEDLMLEVLLPGMDQNGLAFGVARFHDDGRIKEFWWRDVVLRTKR